jgi:probable selenium-dependent hydroxylase accessory protein YqeC
MSAQLLDLLEAREGLVCAVGAGGKKTTLYRLAAGHPGRVGLTATVLTPPFPSDLGADVVVAGPDEIGAAVGAAAASSRVVAFAHPSEKRARLSGLAPERVIELHRAAGFDVTLVKADGARARQIKAPGADEPAIPIGTTTVIPVVSARAIGAVLTEDVAHRVERLAAVTGAEPGARLTAEHVARLLANPEGALKSVGDATVVPLINMVDDRERERAALEAAELALSLTRRFDRIVLAAMRASEPVVRSVER